MIFRADASRRIGSGHVMRCLALAGALHARGAEVHFVCRTHDGHLCDEIERRGFAVTRLTSEAGVAATDDTPTHAAWLGVPWAADAEQTRRAVEAAGARSHWLVVDHYGIDRRWEQALRPAVERLMVIDDLADRPHDCDLLLDQNVVKDMAARYEGRVPPECITLLGPRYAVLQQAYVEARATTAPRRGTVRRILIFFGAADTDNMTARALSASLRLKRSDIIIDVVLTPASPHTTSIMALAASSPNVRVHAGLPTLAGLLAEADLAIGAAGTTTWERMCLGVPSLVVTTAENQRAIAEELDRQEVIRWLGDVATVTEERIADELRSIAERGLTGEWSQRCMEMVDGRGAQRVSAAMLSELTTMLEARAISAADEALLFEWVNDPATRANAFNSGAVTADAHHRWFANRLRSESCRIYLATTTDGTPVGQARFERDGDFWRIDYAVAPAFRGRGYGREVLAAGLLQLRGEYPGVEVVGEVKDANVASCRVFESLGFLARRAVAVIEYRRVL